MVIPGIEREYRCSGRADPRKGDGRRRLRLRRPAHSASAGGRRLRRGRGDRLDRHLPRRPRHRLAAVLEPADGRRTGRVRGRVPDVTDAQLLRASVLALFLSGTLAVLRPPRGTDQPGARSDRRTREDGGGLRGCLSAQRRRGDDGRVPAPVKAGRRDGMPAKWRAAAFGPASEHPCSGVGRSLRTRRTSRLTSAQDYSYRLLQQL